MAYRPKHKPQLTGIVSAPRDCGPRSVQMVIDWATRGRRVPTIRALRSNGRLNKVGNQFTNPWDWLRAVKSYDTARELGGQLEPIKVRNISPAPFSVVAKHLKAGGAVVLAFDYGVYRRAVPRKAGSYTYNGGHAALLLGIRKNKAGVTLVKSYDSLLDGRYGRIPKGPVWVPLSVFKKAAESTGKKEKVGEKVFALLVWPAIKLGGIRIPDDYPIEEVDESPTFASVISDLFDLQDEVVGHTAATLDEILKDFEAVMGGNPFADKDTLIENGVEVS